MPDTTTIIEGEIVPERALEPRSALPAPLLFGTDNPVKIIERASEMATPLAQLIESKGLFVAIRNRKHVQLEGWTLLGTFLRVHPVLRWTRQVTDAEGRWSPPVIKTETKTGTRQDGTTYTYKETVVVEAGHGGWEARVEAVRDGEVYSAGEMECRWEEEKWRTSDSYAVRSMAETRATSKAMRLSLSFVMSLAGFEVTPAEEIPTDSGDGEGGPPVLRGPVSDFNCPACGSPLYDQRKKNEEAEEGHKPPKWACSNEACTGGKGDRPWGSWAATPPGTKPRKAQAAKGDEPVPADAAAGPEEGWRARVTAAVVRYTLDEKTADMIITETEQALDVDLDKATTTEANQVLADAVKAARQKAGK